MLTLIVTLLLIVTGAGVWALERMDKAARVTPAEWEPFTRSYGSVRTATPRGLDGAAVIRELNGWTIAELAKANRLAQAMARGRRAEGTFLN